MKKTLLFLIPVLAIFFHSTSDSVCNAQAICGNGILEEGEECDDGNDVNGDGCHDDCHIEECSAHCDCPQGLFCYYGSCLEDPKMPVYCCDNPGCQPGRWCFKSDGTKGTCAEDPNYFCQSACDCGPGHCCKENMCVKDVNDPWNPGGIEVGPSCVQGIDATYCCSDPLCHAGKHAYGDMYDNFRCANEDTGQPRSFCGGTECYWAGQCAPGESCIDTETYPTPPFGKICRLEGGFCVSNAVIEAVYGVSPSEFFPACSKGCFPGQKCEVGWRTDGEYTVARIVGVCNGTCGNGYCDLGENPSSCPGDCGTYCGDGKCFPEEMPGCSADCSSTSECPDPPPNYGYQMCGDGECQQDGYIPENCLNCSQDCGPPTDDDGDNITDCIDNCPSINNPDQADADSDGIGDACDYDSDNDGVLDDNDQCPSTASGELVDDSGCSITDLCPCDNQWKNHGAYVKCVAHSSNDFVSEGLITEFQKDDIVSNAAESECGHKK